MIRRSWLNKYFGTSRGFLWTILYKVLSIFGKYRRYQDVKWESVERIVFICKGNICRSAFAEAVARNMGFKAISCGLEAIENAPANEQAIRTAHDMGFDLASHKTRPIMYLILKKSDLLVLMEPSQATFLQNNLDVSCQYTLLGLWRKPKLPYIQDPFGMSPAYFDKCFNTIKEAIDGICENICKKIRD